MDVISPMNEHENEHTPPVLDTLIQNRPIQMLKAIVPYLYEPQQHKSKIIQIMLLHPHPLSLEHPQFVAAKSLMLIASRFLFTIHSMYVACQCFLKKMRIFYH